MKKKIYLALSFLAPVFVILAAYFLGARAYLLAWECSIVVLLLMEFRIQVGKRLPRTTAFWIHLPASVLYLVLLTWLTFWPHPALLYPIVETFFVISVCAGSVLWWRGIQAASQLPFQGGGGIVSPPMKITHFIASGITSVALLAAVAAPSLASASQYMYPTSYNNGYNYTVSTPYNCGSYWSSQPCNYSYSNSTYQQYQYSYPSYNYSYSYPQYQYQNQYQYQTYPYSYQNYGYQNQWYGNGYNYGYSNNVCPVGYYLWGKNCWPNPQAGNNQFWYPIY